MPQRLGELEGSWGPLAGCAGSPERVSERINLVQSRAFGASGGKGTRGSGELGVRMVPVLEVCKAVCLVTSEIDACN